MTKKETLKVSNFDDNENILLFTIVSSESDIHLCLLINKIFKISLSLSDDIIVPSKNESFGFRKYECEDPEEGEKFILLVNKNNSGKYLFPEFKKIDYIFIVISEMPNISYDKRLLHFKEDKAVSAFFKIDHLKVKSFSKIKL